MDMTMCSNGNCNKRFDCLRFMTGMSHDSLHIYLHDPRTDCEGNDYEYYVDNGEEK